MHKDRQAEITSNFEKTRNTTLQILELAEEAALHVSPGFGFRPILWHLAHLGTFEEYWLRQKVAGQHSVNNRFQIIFDPIKTPRENSTDLPTKVEMLDYLQNVRASTYKILENFDFSSRDPLLNDGYVFDLVHQHELQHQETLAYLFHLLPLEKVPGSRTEVPSSKFQRSARFEIPGSNSQTVRDESRFAIHDSLEISAGEVEIGADGNVFAYDNEMPAHTVFVSDFKLDRCLTTNAEFAEFIAEKGYERPEFWSVEGWIFKENENWQHPLYWQKAGNNDWRIRLLFEEKPLDDITDHPVYGISFYEAEAYAKFCGKRLPTEFELEKAASWNRTQKEKKCFVIESPSIENCNFNFYYSNTTPVSSFAENPFDLAGNLWEWTTSDFKPYPHFLSFPYEEYSQTWFDGDHKVLKGGSFATSKEILRTSFRNFFRRHFRIAFAGIRCAIDIYV